MGSVLLLIDNSNIFIGGRNKFGINARFSYAKFEKVCAGNDVIVEKYLAGSTPPANDAFWDRMKINGYKVRTYERVSAGYGHQKEKAVDMSIGVMGGAAIQRLKPDRVVLLTGDRDFIPISELRDEMRTQQGHSFVLDVWSFSESLSSEIQKVCDNIFRIEDYKKDLIYFQYKDGTTESFIEHEEKMAAENAAREESWNAYRASQKEREADEAEAAKKRRKTVGKIALGGAAIGCIIVAIRRLAH